MTELAIEKLRKEAKEGKYDRYAAVMKDGVLQTLKDFCRQDGEFAQAVYQGGSFEDCMKAVAKGCKNGHGLPDLEAYRRAVRFYFKGADIRFRMELNLCADVERAAGISEPAQDHAGQHKMLDLSSFF